MDSSLGKRKRACSCSHPDLSTTGGIICCLSCGEIVESLRSQHPPPADSFDAGNDPDRDEFVKLGNFADSDSDSTFGDPDDSKNLQKPGYSTINRDVKEIRLLTLYAGNSSDPITGRIFHCVLRSIEQPSYEAVSYTWADGSGDTSYSCTVYCDQGEVQVTSNCQCVLATIRYKDRSRIVWIDQLCIDQTNIAERSHQVCLMPEIYADASQVLVCLPEMQAIPWGKSAVHYDEDSFDQMTTEFLQQPWFSRIWVLQEVANARKALLLGSKFSLDWEKFKNAIYKWHTVKKREDEYDSWMDPPNQIKTAPVVLPSALNLQLRNLVPANELLDLLQSARGCSAGDPRDKVFALFGIVLSPATFGLEADYKKSTAAVFTEIALYLIRKTGTLNVLSHCQRERPTIELPSWVPDWSLPHGPLLKHLVGDARWPYSYRTSIKARSILSGGPWIVPFYDQPSKILPIRGRRLGVISLLTFKEYLVFLSNIVSNIRVKTSKEYNIYSFETDIGEGFSIAQVALDDEIWQVDGSDVLFALRKYGGSYRLVGECYLRGFTYHDCSFQEDGVTDSLQACPDCRPYHPICLEPPVSITLV